MKPLRVAWLTTGRGPGSYGALEYVLNRIDEGLPVKLEVVFVNRDPGEAEATDRLMAMVRDHGIALQTMSSVAYRKSVGGKLSKPGEPLPAWREAFDDKVVARLEPYGFDIGVMFGYMLIATEPLYSRWRFLNDHPALPDGPIGTYQEVIAELIRTRARESGCLMNIVTGDVDRGPVISFCRYAIQDAANAHLWQRQYSEADLSPAVRETLPLYQDIRARGVVRERPFLAATLEQIAAGRIDLDCGEPADLTAEVEASVKKDAAREPTR